jgi:hypothetical protein
MRKTRVLNQLASKLCAASLLALLSGSAAHAQIPVTSAGAGPLTFTALPPVTQWSWRSIAGGGTTFTDTTSVSNSLATNAAANINSALTTDTATTPGTLAGARWNSALQALQTRPTGNGGTYLMGTFSNASPGVINDMDISFDFGVYVPLSGEMVGHEVFYSLTGNAGEWTRIDALSVNETVGAHTAPLSGLNWAPNSLFYLLFFDDNANSITDPGYTIDNLAISFPNQPAIIVQDPVSQTNNEYSVVTLTAAAGGTPPLAYQWKRNGTDIAGATSPTLRVTNILGTGYTWSRPEDSGDYTVVVTGSVLPAATSATATVLILPDTNAPSFLKAFTDTNSAGDVVVRIVLSERIANAMSQLTEPLYWSIDPVSGPGPQINPSTNILVNTNVTFATTNTIEVQLVLESGVTLDPTTTYKVTFDSASEGALFDRAQTKNYMAVPEIPLYSKPLVLVPLTATWKYSDLDLAPVGNWWENAYNDSDTAFWKTGAGPFDAKRGGCRTTALHNLGPVGTCLTITNLNNPLNTNSIPAYYFRTHFDFPGAVPPNVMLVLNGKVDDGAVFYLNGQPLYAIGFTNTLPIEHTNYSTRSVGDSDAQDVMYLFPGSQLHSGDNVLAVHLAQVNATSSDITLGLQVRATTISPLGPYVPAPQLTISRNGNQVSVGWTPLGGSLLEASAVTGPWTTNGAALNPHVFTPAPGAGQKFFRVVQ